MNRIGQPHTTLPLMKDRYTARSLLLPRMNAKEPATRIPVYHDEFPRPCS